MYSKRAGARLLNVQSFMPCGLLVSIRVNTCKQGFQYFSSLPVFQILTAVLFIKNLTNFHEYLMQHSIKSGGTKDNFRLVKVPGTASY